MAVFVLVRDGPAKISPVGEVASPAKVRFRFGVLIALSIGMGIGGLFLAYLGIQQYVH